MASPPPPPDPPAADPPFPSDDEACAWPPPPPEAWAEDEPSLPLVEDADPEPWPDPLADAELVGLQLDVTAQVSA